MRVPLFAFLLFLLISEAYAQDVVMPGHDNPSYVNTLLKHVLSYSPDKNYQVKFHNTNLPKLRVLEVIAQKQGIDVIAAGATTAREKLLLPIRIPLLKGLYGWRIPLVSTQKSDLFKNISTTEDFKKLTPGQLHSWSDTAVLEGNGITIEKASSYEGLFSMLATQRFDYFPRSMIEIDWELKNYQHLDIIKDSYSLIHYPTAYYFYINKDNNLLEKDIIFGLESALKDGSFEKLFMQFYGDIINKVRAENRKIFHLKNPLLSDKTPLHKKELWLNLADK